MNKKKNKSIILLLTLVALPAMGQRIVAERDVIDCGKVMYEHPVTVSYELRNEGGSQLLIDDVRTSCGCTTVSFPRDPIPPQSSFTVAATYDARQLGHFNKQLGIYSNASDKPLLLGLKGVVVEKIVDFSGEYPYSIGDVRIDINNIEFDDVSSGDMPIQKIHIQNNSAQTIAPVLMHLPDYLKAYVSPTRIAPGHSGEATVTLFSKKLRNFGLTQTSIYLGMFPGDRVSSEKEIEVSAVLLPGFSTLTDFQRANAPQLKLSTYKLDVDFQGKSKKQDVILVQNVGKSTLEIQSVQVFTSGIELTVPKSQLAPGEEVKMKITTRAKELKNVRTQPRILMITNDPDNAKAVITLNVK